MQQNKHKQILRTRCENEALISSEAIKALNLWENISGLTSKQTMFTGIFTACWQKLKLSKTRLLFWESRESKVECIASSAYKMKNRNWLHSICQTFIFFSSVVAHFPLYSKTSFLEKQLVNADFLLFKKSTTLFLETKCYVFPSSCQITMSRNEYGA